MPGLTSSCTNAGAVDDLTVIGNLIEAGLWLVFAIAFGVMAGRASGPKRRLWAILAGAFFVFALSDVVESRTGAWWRPWWLLVVKTSCIAVFLYGVREYLRIAKSTGRVKPESPVSRPAVGPGAREG